MLRRIKPSKPLLVIPSPLPSQLFQASFSLISHNSPFSPLWSILAPATQLKWFSKDRKQTHCPTQDILSAFILLDFRGESVINN
jgi:hypothetical protein